MLLQTEQKLFFFLGFFFHTALITFVAKAVILNLRDTFYSLFCAKTSIVYFPLLLLPLPEREHIYTIQRFSCLSNFSNTTVNEEIEF